MFECLAQAFELGHALALEFLNILVLSFQLTSRFVLELAELEGLVSTFLVNLLMEFILGVVDFLHDVFLSFDACLALAVEFVLKVWAKGTVI